MGDSNSTRPHVVDYWGGCPTCGCNDGFVTVGWSFGNASKGATPACACPLGASAIGSLYAHLEARTEQPGASV